MLNLVHTGIVDCAALLIGVEVLNVSRSLMFIGNNSTYVFNSYEHSYNTLSIMEVIKS